jgi:hypothetical protein
MKKNLLRKAIYLVLFIALTGCFIYISEKYKDNSKEVKITITDYHKDFNKDTYEVIGGNKFISLLQNGNSIILIGSKTSDWSKYYAENINKVIEELEISKVYYYDINNDKSQKNSNYYEIKKLLKGSLTTTDGSNSNLLAPSFYIIKDGKVAYYNTDTVAMKNTEEPKNYWNEEQKIAFNSEIKDAINKYYLNNK